MLSHVKQAIKAVVPQARINWARDKVDRVSLARVERVAFDAGNLGREPDIRRAFVAQPASWDQDHAAISAIYGSGEKGGGINPGDRRALYYVMAFLRPKRVLEIGTHIAFSTIYMASALRDHGRITTVDIDDINSPTGHWADVGLVMSPRDAANALGLSIEFRTHDGLSYMRSAKEKFDVIFLDGDHRPSTIYLELSAAMKILAPGGVILMHDYYPGARRLAGPDVIYGPYRAASRARRENPEISVRPLGELPWETKCGSRMTSLAAVERRDHPVFATSNETEI